MVITLWAKTWTIHCSTTVQMTASKRPSGSRRIGTLGFQRVPRSTSTVNWEFAWLIKLIQHASARQLTNAILLTVRGVHLRMWWMKVRFIALHPVLLFLRAKTRNSSQNSTKRKVSRIHCRWTNQFNDGLIKEAVRPWGGGPVVRAPDLKSGSREFKSRSDYLAEVVSQ